MFALSSFELSASMRSLLSRESADFHPMVLNKMFRFIMLFWLQKYLCSKGSR